jgi:tRNA synthetases class I (W and Y)
MESEQGMSFTEFTYQLLQGFDFVHLCKEQGVRVQVGPVVWHVTITLRLSRISGNERTDCT